MSYPLLPVLEVTVEYRPATRVSRRVLDVVRAFGLGERDEYFTVFKDFRLEWDDPAVIYVTGESGGGKTTLLRAFKRLYGGKALDVDEVEVEEDEVLCESIGRDTGEALYFLSLAGLGEAMLFVRSYRELSAGQRYRYRLAKAFYRAVSEDREAVVVDEFCSLLDRVTARVVAYTCQKFARRFGKTLIAASSHEDLAEDLNPDILVVKPFLEAPRVEYRRPKPKQFSLLGETRIVEGRLSDYKKLERFHYRGFTPAFPAKVFKATYRGRPVGVIVYSCPPLAHRSRRRVFGSNLVEYAKSKKLLTITRVVVHPSWRGVGLGVKLVKDTLPATGADVVEATAAMAVYNPFFEKAGMKLGDTLKIEYDSTLRELDALLTEYGFNPRRRISWRAVYDFLSSLPEKKLREFEEKLGRLQAPKATGQHLEKKRRLERGGLSLHQTATYIFSYPHPGSTYNYYYWVRPGAEVPCLRK